MNSAARLALRFARFVILLHSQFPGELEPFEQLLRGRLRQADGRRAHPAPTAGDGEEHFPSLGDKQLLQLGGQNQVPEPEMLMGKSRKDAAAYAEVGSAHVGAFLGAVKAKGDVSKIACVHERCLAWWRRAGPEPVILLFTLRP